MRMNKILIPLLIIAITVSIVEAYKENTQDQLGPTPSNILTINLSKKERTYEHKKQIILMLQSKLKALKDPSFVETKTFNLDQKESVTLPLENHANTVYTGPVGIGTSKNTFDMVFDTGSVAFFVDSTLCPQQTCKSHHQFDPSKSISYKPPANLQPMAVQFGSGELSGAMGYDDVFFGDTLKVKQFGFYLIAQENNILQNAYFDGVMGLSKPFPNGDGSNSYSVFDNMISTKVLEQNLFTFYLRRDDKSAVTMGGIDTSRIQGEISWHPVIHESYWMIQMDSIFLNDQDSKLCNKNCAAILDSGTSLITGPENDLLQLEQLLGDVDCKDFKKMPTINFQFANAKYSLPPDDYVVTLKGDQLEFYTHSNAEDIEDCAGTFMPFNIVSEGKKVWILGDTFMSKHVVIFDRGNNKIGLALQKDL